MSAKLFHEATLSYGGRLDTRRYDRITEFVFDKLRRGAEQWIISARNSHPKLPPIHFDYIASETPDARAILYKGQRFIGVSKGMMEGLMALFQRMLSDRRILSQIGDPKDELEHRPLTQPLLSTLVQENHKNGPTPPKRSRPNGVLRCLMANGIKLFDLP